MPSQHRGPGLHRLNVSNFGGEMSWGEKKLTLPFVSSRTHGHVHSPAEIAQYTHLECRKDLVRAEYLRKVKTNRLKWFALYPASATVPAHLEYHDSERKWELGSPPARVVVLKDCLNICRQHDARHRLVLALYTLEDCLSIQFEKEEDLRVWLDLLLSLQKGRADDGKILQPTYEHMWQVTVKRFDPDDKLNTFTMCGQHRLCVTDGDLRFFEMGSSTPLVFPVISLRQCMCNDRFFHLETGRSSPSGAGVLVLLCEDRDSAADLNIQTIKAMESSSTIHTEKSRSRSSSHKGESHLNHDHSHKSAPSSSRPSRPRAGSFTNVIGRMGSGNSSSISPMASLDESPHLSSMRNRTVSEGSRFAFRPRRSARTVVHPAASASPKPHVTFDPTGSAQDHSHLLSSNASTSATIFEESSNESWVDPNASRSSPQKSTSPRWEECRSNSFSCSGITSQASSPPSTAASPPSAPQSNTGQVPTPKCPTQATAEEDSNDCYIVMSPNANFTNAINQNADKTGSSPSARDSTPPSQNVIRQAAEESARRLQDDDNVYCVMSPQVISRGTIEVAAEVHAEDRDAPSERVREDIACEDEGYIIMSPISGKTIPLSENLSMNEGSKTAVDKIIEQPWNAVIEHNDADYVVMSPVSVDPDKLHRAFELAKPIEQPLDPEISFPELPFIDHSKPQASMGSASSLYSDDSVGLTDGHWSPMPLGSVVDPAWEAEQFTRHHKESDLEAQDIYACIDYSGKPSSRPSRAQGIPIPDRAPGTSSRVSPASTSSGMFGTPNSSESRFPAEVKTRSYLRKDDDESVSSPSPSASQLPSRTQSVSTMSKVVAPTRSRTSSFGNQLLEVPSRLSASSKQLLGRSPPAGHAPHGAVHSPNIRSFLGDFFRSRTGSVPSKAAADSRRRHRTQSEGEGEVQEAHSKLKL